MLLNYLYCTCANSIRLISGTPFHVKHGVCDEDRMELALARAEE